jgi:hypothetical protein
MDPKAVQKWDEDAVGEWIRLQLMMMMMRRRRRRVKRRDWIKYQ